MRFASAIASLLATSLSVTVNVSSASAFVVATATGAPTNKVFLARSTAAVFAARGGATTSASTTTTARHASTISTTEEDATASKSTSSNNYDQLVEALQEITHLSRASAVLGYDQMVFMPQTDGASKARGQQSAALATVIHEKSISPKLGELLTKAEQEASTKDQQRVVALARKAYDKKTKIPTPLASKQASLSSEAYNTWAQARAADDYSLFSGILGECVEVAQQVAAAVQTEEEKQAGKSLYATMLDEFEVGMDPARIQTIFDEVQAALVPLLERVLGQDATPPSTDILKGHFEVPAQEALSKQIVRQMKFEGRIDVSVHPFSSGISKHDVRITSRFREDEWYQGLAGSMHEAGHALYEQNLGDSGLPTDSALSMGMHESQSLFWERHVGLSKPFWDYATPLVKEHLGIENATPEQLYEAVNAAHRSLIRVEADELTYPLHVILRYQLERDFVEGRMNVKDLPEQWNAGMKSLLQVDVPNNAQGCLQDVHWSMMAYGYFPTYLLGAIAAAQWAHCCRLDIPNFDELVAQGDFDPIKEWMTDKVHKHGSRYPSLDDHLQDQVGEKLNPKYFIDYLTEKYTELYQC